MLSRKLVLAAEEAGTLGSSPKKSRADAAKQNEEIQMGSAASRRSR